VFLHSCAVDNDCLHSKPITFNWLIWWIVKHVNHKIIIKKSKVLHFSPLQSCPSFSLHILRDISLSEIILHLFWDYELNSWMVTFTVSVITLICLSLVPLVFCCLVFRDSILYQIWMSHLWFTFLHSYITL